MTDRPIPGDNAAVFGSDPMALLLRELGHRYIALTPGASFRGLHDSLVNYLGNEKPELLLCIHEESAVALAHGWTRVTGKPMPVALHSNVGLMHATMAIFNAWCDRIPMVILGAQGPLDAMARRPWVDWIHTSTDLGSLLRGYTKWDNQPASVPAALESILRAHQIATTEPCGPTYVCLDAGLQEMPLATMPERPPLARFAQPASAEPDAAALDVTLALLRDARRPLLMLGRVSPKREHWDRRVRLAEKLGAHVLTDIKTGASFPTAHPAQPFPPTLYVTPEAGGLIRDADVIVALDWIDPAGTMRQACSGELPKAKVVLCSLDQYSHNGWSMDYQALPPADVNMLASPDKLVERLLSALEKQPDRARATVTPSVQKPGPDMIEGRISVEAMARTIVDTLAAEGPSSYPPAAGLARRQLPFLRPTRLHRLRRRRRHRLRPRHGRRRGDGAPRTWAAPACRSRFSATAIISWALRRSGPQCITRRRSWSWSPTTGRSSMTSCIRSGWPGCGGVPSRTARSASGWRTRTSTSPCWPRGKAPTA